MTHDSQATQDRYPAARRATGLGVGVVIAGAGLFFAALAALGEFREFIAGPGDGTLSGDALADLRRGLLVDHHTQVVVGWGLIGLGQLLLGIGTSIIALGLARAETAWRANVARVAAVLCIAGGATSGLTYAWPGHWTDDEALVGIGETTTSLVLFYLGWGIVAAGLLGLASVLVAGQPWPTRTGLVLVAFAVLPFVTALPLFHQVGATVAGIGLLLALHPSRLERTATPVDEHSA